MQIDANRTARRGVRCTLICAAAILLATVAPPGAAARTVWTEVKPDRANAQVCLRFENDEGVYYRLDEKNAVELTLYGPDKLRLLTRHLPRRGNIGRRSYTLVVMRDGKVALKKLITKGRSRSVVLCNDVTQAVGASMESKITIPDGKHVVRIYVEEQDESIAVRLYEQTRTRQRLHVHFAPIEFAGILTLAMPSGNEYPWYHATRETPVKYTVRGPTELELRTRCDFDSAAAVDEMRYGVELLRNGVSHRVFYYTTQPYDEAAYKEPVGLAPGSSKLIEVQVPDGMWTYEIRPAQPDLPTFTVRTLIPKEDLGLGDDSP